MPRKKLTLMVSSAVYGNESLLDQVYAVLDGYGYEVWMSHKGTVPVSSQRHAFEDCLEAVDRCDIFLGIITGRYGSGKLPGELSITHREVIRAVEQQKLRWFLAHHDVAIARQLLQQFRFDSDRKPLPLNFKRTAVLDDIRILDMYDEAIQDNVPLKQRVGNWVQTYRDSGDVLRFMKAQFAAPQRIRQMMSDSERTTK